MVSDEKDIQLEEDDGEVLTEHKRQQIEKKTRFNEKRVEWLLAYMHGEKPYFKEMNVSRDRTQVLEIKEQFAMGELIQAGIAAKMLMSKVDDSYRVQSSVSADTDEIVEMLEQEGWGPEALAPRQKRNLRLLIEDAEEARLIFAEKNLGLVSLIAGRRRHSSSAGSVDFDDLVEEGKVGLMKAIDRFDPSMGNKFSTPATWWIDQPIRSYLDSKAKTIRMPTHMNNLYKNIQYALKELRNVYMQDEEITDEMIVEYCREHGKEITVEQIERTREYRRETISYDDAITDKGGSREKTLADMIKSDEDVSGDVVKAIGSSAEFNRLLALVEDHNKRKILRDWYSAKDTPELVVLSNVSRKYGLTRERARQLKNEAETELRAKLTSGRYREY